jgi:hypothetical protein
MTERTAKVYRGAGTWLAAMADGKVRHKKPMQHRFVDVLERNALRSQPPSKVRRALQIVLDGDTCISSTFQVSRESSNDCFKCAVPCPIARDDFRNDLRDHDRSPERWR